MALFYKRPLACACACFTAAVFLAFFLSTPLCFLLAGVFLLTALVLLGFCLFRGFSYRKLFILLAVSALFLGFLRPTPSRLATEDTLTRYQGKGVTAELTIREVLYQNAYGAEFLAKVSCIDLQPKESTVVLRFSCAAPFGVGDRISGEFTVQSLEYEAYREGAANRYFSEGAEFLCLCEDVQSLSLLKSGTNSLRAKLSRLRATAVFRITDTVGGEEGKLLSAMLLGARSKLSDATARDFRLSGVSHLLALSGLHLMILVGIADRILYLLHASKRLRIATVIPLCLFYLVLTGCNYSLLRATLMLGAVYLSFLLREDHDSITALFLCAALILCVTPYAILSLSFQMTMLATFGMLAFARSHAFLCKILPVKKRWQALPFKLLRGILSSILITLTTTLCLTPVLWLTLGTYSLMTPLANLLLVPIAPVLLFSAVLCLLIPFSAVGSAAGLVGRAVLILTRFLASFDLMLSLTRAYVPYILIPLILCSAFLLLIDLKKRYRLTLVPFGIAILAFAIIIPISNRICEAQLEVGYRCTGKNEGIVLVQGDSAVLCDASGSGLTQWRADWYMAQKMGATRLEALMLTHYHSKSISALSRFAQDVYVHALWLPQPQTKEEKSILLQILEIAQGHALSVTVFDHEQALTVFERGTLMLQTPLYHSRSSEPAFSLSVTYGTSTLCYHTAALSEYLRAKGEEHTCNATHLVLGAHGPVPHDTVQIPQNDTLTTVLIGSEKALLFLEMRQNLRYYPFPSEKIYVLK